MKKLKLLSGKNVWISILLIAFSFVVPFIINVHNMKIYPGLFASIENNDQGLLIITSFKLVLMNSIRCLPIYLSSFTVIEAMKESWKGQVSWYFIVLGLLIVPVFYRFIELFLSIHYDFGVTSLVILFMIWTLVKMNLNNISLVKKAVFVILLLLGLQWVDIIPFLSEYGFGRGEVSYEIKRTIEFMDAVDSVSFFSIMFFSFFILMSLMILKLLKDQNRDMNSIEQRNEMSLELQELKIQSLKTRSYEEMQNLVHDLRSPLTSIQALASLSSMHSEDKKMQLYMNKISGSVDQLTGMISEILYENTRQRITIDSLLDALLSHLSPRTESDGISCINNAGGSIEINKIRFIRMLINLINNSISAIDKKDNVIELIVSKREKSIDFKVRDNGKGITPDDLDHILKRGFSTKGSSGIGLRYVEDVVNNHKGNMKIESVHGEGTLVTLTFLKNEINYEENISY